ncbi:MAG TPA: YceI family protein [Candidatus Binatia bacterium]|jgi:polyisoprenoid-binding protein YceI
MRVSAAILALSLTFLILSVPLEAAEPPAPGRYRIDPAESHIVVRAFAAGFFSAFAHDHTIAARDFDGAAVVEAGGGATLRLTARAASLGVVDKISDGDRRDIETTMRGPVLEAERFPEIVFRSTRVEARANPDGSYRARIAGDLTLHGVTRALSISTDVTIDNGRLRARGRFPLLQTDYKITPVSLFGGTVRVKDEIEVTFDVAAVKE